MQASVFTQCKGAFSICQIAVFCMNLCAFSRQVVDGLTAACLSLSVDMRTSVKVDEVCTSKNQQVTGVRLSDGQVIPADIVICNR